MPRNVCFESGVACFIWLGLFVYSWAGVSSKNAYAAPPNTAIPLPCNESIGLFSARAHYSDCALQFGSCDKTLSGPGYLSGLTDQIMQDVILIEIQGIYKGTDPYSSGNTLSALRPAEFVGPNPTGMGECTGVGACNLFCGEGLNKAVKADLAGIDDPVLGSQGYRPNTTTSLVSGIPASMTPSDFTAIGAVTSYYNDKDQEITIAPPNPLPSPPDGGWPTFTLKNADKLAGSGILCGPRSGDQTSLAQTGFYNTVYVRSDNLPLNYSYLVDSISWADSTYSNEGGGPCHAISYSDFTNASGIAALQTGVLVQALWMKLDEVLTEISQNKYLNVISSKCTAFRETYFTDLDNSVKALYEIPTSTNCTKIPETCQQSANYQSLGPTAFSVEGISTCETGALLHLLKSSSFEKMAVCEVYERAQTLFDTVLNTPTGKEGQASPMAWVNQLRNYAITSCMNRKSPFTGDYAYIDPEAAAMGALLASALALILVPVGWSLMITFLAFIAKGAEMTGPYLAADLVNKTFWDAETEMKARYATDVQKCFPYAYSALFYSYLLKTNLLKTVPIQGPSNNPFTSPSGLLTVSGCKLTDKTRHPSPPPQSQQ